MKIRTLKHHAMPFGAAAIFGGAVCAGILILAPARAEAALVCSGQACWHVPDGSVAAVVHDDNWQTRRNVSFRARDSRSYWDRWIIFGTAY